MRMFTVIGVLVLLVSGGFRVVGAFAWVAAHWVDFPLVTLGLGMAVAMVPWFGWWAAFTMLQKTQLGPMATGVLLLPSIYGDFIASVALLSPARGFFSLNRLQWREIGKQAIVWVHVLAGLIAIAVMMARGMD